MLVPGPGPGPGPELEPGPAGGQLAVVLPSVARAAVDLVAAGLAAVKVEAGLAVPDWGPVAALGLVVDHWLEDPGRSGVGLALEVVQVEVAVAVVEAG